MQKRHSIGFLLSVFILNVVFWPLNSTKILSYMKNRELSYYIACYLHSYTNDGTQIYSSTAFDAMEYALKKVDKKSFDNLDLSNQDLSHENLKRKSFKYDNFKGSNLIGAKVKDADFTRAKGLSNEQKAYLRGHGALNVPVDIEYDLDDYCEVGTDIKKVRFYKKLFKRFGRLYRRIRKLNKDAETQVVEEDLNSLVSEIEENLKSES